jgi:hypothetical protein
MARAASAPRQGRRHHRSRDGSLDGSPRAFVARGGASVAATKATGGLPHRRGRRRSKRGRIPGCWLRQKLVRDVIVSCVYRAEVSGELPRVRCKSCRPSNDFGLPTRAGAGTTLLLTNLSKVNVGTCLEEDWFRSSKK